MATRWSGGAAFVPMVSRTFGKWLNFHAPAAKGLLCKCLGDFKVQGSTDPARAAEKNASTFDVRVEAAGSGKVLLSSLELGLDDDVAALFRKLSTALRGQLGVGQLQLFLGHGGDEILEYEDQPRGDGTPPAGDRPDAPVPNHRRIVELGIAVSGSPLVVSHQRYVNRTIECPDECREKAWKVKICPSGEFAVVAFPRALQIFRLASGIPTASIPLEFMLNAGCAFDISARGDLVALGSSSMVVPTKVWAVGSLSNTTTNNVRIHAELQGTVFNKVSCVAITRDDKYVVAAKEKIISVWDLEDEEIIHTLVVCVADYYGRFCSSLNVCVSYVECVVCCWLLLFQGHVRSIKVVHALGDGNIVSAATDSASILWSPSTGMRLRRFAAYIGEPLSVVQGHDGFMYVTMREQRDLSIFVVSDNPARRKSASQTRNMHTRHAKVAAHGSTLVLITLQQGGYFIGARHTLMLEHWTSAPNSLATSSARNNGPISDLVYPLQWPGGPHHFNCPHFDISEDGQSIVFIDNRASGTVLEVRRLQGACEDSLRADTELE